MMRSLRIGIAILAVACRSTAFAADVEDKPVMPLSEWIERLASDEQETRQAANEALGIYETWLYDLPDFLGDGNPWAERDRIRSELKQHVSTLTKLLNGKHEESRQTAAGLLGLLGSDASSASKALLDVIRSKETSDELRMSTFVALLHVMPADEPVGPLLLEVYPVARQGKDGNKGDKNSDDEDFDDVRGSGIAAVYYCRLLISSGRTMIEVPTLVELAGPRYPRLIRGIAITVLAELASDSRAAIPGLRKLLADEDLLLRKAVGAALLCIEGDPRQLDTVAEELNLSDEDRLEFKKSMSEMFEEIERLRKSMAAIAAEDAEAVVPVIIQQLKYGPPFSQRQAIRVLSEIGSPAKAAIPELTAATTNPEEATREAAKAALKQIDSSLPVRNE
jgi:HEAT repeat protein